MTEECLRCRAPHTLLQHLPKELRPAAQAAKKRAARVQERLNAASAALRLLRTHADGKPAAAKLCKALDALLNVKVRVCVCACMLVYGTTWCS